MQKVWKIRPTAQATECLSKISCRPHVRERGTLVRERSLPAHRGHSRSAPFVLCRCSASERACMFLPLLLSASAAFTQAEGASAAPIQVVMRQEIAVARRLVAAIRNERPYEDSDFITPLSQSDKASLSAFSTCSADSVGHNLDVHPSRPNTLVRVPGSISIRWRCRQRSRGMPTHLSIELKNGRIETIATHVSD